MTDTSSTYVNMAGPPPAFSPKRKALPEPEVPAVAQELPQESRLNISDLFADCTPEQLEAGVERGISILDSLKATLEERGANSIDAGQWIQSIGKVRAQAVKTKTIMGVVGATGAGKSSVINAMLDEERLVPTNCMRACTAVVTEISYNYEETPYGAEIEFISAIDWQKELEVLFQDLFDFEGKVSRECANEESEAGIAYAKLKAVYPRLTKEDMQTTSVDKLMTHDNVKCLGALRKLAEKDPLIFYKKLQGYVDSAEKSSVKSASEKKKGPREMEYWPLIRVVRLYTKAAALETGAVIVDLPGVHDSNQARAAVAQGYLKQCTGLWIVAPITRAVDDKSAKSLLGESFRRQLKMDGGYNSVTFICSKTDDISLMEATSSLGLEEEMSLQWTKMEDSEKDIRALKKELEAHKTSKGDFLTAMENADEDLDVWEKLRDDLEDGITVLPPAIISSKRKRSSAKTTSSRKKARGDESDGEFSGDGADEDGNSDDEASVSPSGADAETGESLSGEDISMKIRELKDIKRSGRLERSKLDEKIKDIRTQVASLRRKIDQIEAQIAAACISGRNNYSRDAIRQDFAAGIKELDQELAEEEDAANFNPEQELRDYEEVARSLPVYCFSSRGYQKLMGRLKKDADVPGFKDVTETEIPLLQAHCKKLTEAGRQTTCRRFLNSLSQLLNSLRLWSSSDGSGRNLTEGQLKYEALWLQDRLSKFDTTLERKVKDICNSLTEEYQGNIFESFETAIAAAANAAPSTAAHWGQKVNRDDCTAGGLYWSTYKAVCRRDGVFRDLNFNEQLIEPVIKQIATGWEKAFSRGTPSVLAGLPTLAGDIVRTLHQDIEERCLRGGGSAASFQILQQSIPTYTELLKDAAKTARTTISERQRDINREFTPVITEHMLDAYSGCVAECGSGSYMRMKALMARHVESQRRRMFTKSTSKVESLVETLVEDAERLLLAKADEVYASIKQDYESVLMGDSSATKQLPREQRQMRRKVLDLLEVTELAFKQVLGWEPKPEDHKRADPTEKGADTETMNAARTEQIDNDKPGDLGAETALEAPARHSSHQPLQKAVVSVEIEQVSGDDDAGSERSKQARLDTELSIDSTGGSLNESVNGQYEDLPENLNDEGSRSSSDVSGSQSDRDTGFEFNYTSDEF